MSQTVPPYLRLHVEQSQAPCEPLDALPEIKKMTERFEQVTGWSLAFRESPESFRRRQELQTLPPPPQGRLYIDDMSASLPAGKAACHRVRCDELVASINELIAEVDELKTNLWKREAELATGVPVIQPQDDSTHIANRLQSSMQAAVEATDACAAALYVLDDATSELKLRSAIGLPDDALRQSARPLQGALADLEALLGHAVVIEDTDLLRHWNPPEAFPAAACVPVSSASTPLGTLWVFADENRDFNAEQTNLLEIVAGRIAAELEREAALGQGQQSVEVDRHLEQAQQWQEARIPNIEPLIDEVEIKGWTQQSGPLGGDFHCWTVQPDGNLAISLGDVQAPMMEAGLGAANLQALVQAHAEYQNSPSQVLSRVGESLWSGSQGDQFASLLHGVFDIPQRSLTYSAAGCVGLLFASKTGVEALSDIVPPLGGDPDHFYSHSSLRIQPNDLFIAFSDGVRHRLAIMGVARGDEELAALIGKTRWSSADHALNSIREWLSLGQSPMPQYDMSLIVIRGRS